MKQTIIYSLFSYKEPDEDLKDKAVLVDGISNIEYFFSTRVVRDKSIAYIHDSNAIDKTELELAFHRAARVLQSKGEIGAYEIIPMTEPFNNPSRSHWYLNILTANGYIKQAKYAILANTMERNVTF